MTDRCQTGIAVADGVAVDIAIVSADVAVVTVDVGLRIK